jgi:hypothetical protein
MNLLRGQNEQRSRRARSRRILDPFYATGFGPTRDASPRQLPTNHDYAVPTREYQTDQPSHKLPRPLLVLSSNQLNNNKPKRG